MKKLSRTIEWSILSQDELKDHDLMLVNAAKEATTGSWSPYSGFKVGAALLLDDGTVVTGSNQENAAYPSGLCAERTAVFYAGSRYPDQPIRRLCIAARDTNGQFLPRPISPCGACRQVLLEAEQRAGGNIEVLLYGTEGIYCIRSIKDLLPLGFDESFL